MPTVIVIAAVTRMAALTMMAATLLCFLFMNFRAKGAPLVGHIAFIESPYRELDIGEVERQLLIWSIVAFPIYLYFRDQSIFQLVSKINFARLAGAHENNRAINATLILIKLVQQSGGGSVDVFVNRYVM